MRRFWVLIVICCSSISTLVGSHPRESLIAITITTVNQNGSPMKAETVRWWYEGQRNVKHDLHCKTELCSEWVIDEPLTGSFVIHADRSIVKKEDAHCWDLYLGEREIKEWKDIESIEIMLTYSSTACS